MAWYPSSYGMAPGSYGAPMTAAPAYTYQQPQAAPVMQSGASPAQGIVWVDGEIGAKAYQFPAGVQGPIALWDTNDQVIYLKSMNPMGMPNPLQRIRYQIEDVPQMLPSGSGSQSAAESAYATKEDMDSLRSEIQSLKETLTNRRNQNGGQGSQSNRSGGGMNA